MKTLDVSDTVRALVLRSALDVYCTQQYRMARDARDARKMRAVFATRQDRVRYAQECDARRRVALAMLAEMEGDA